MTIHRDPPRSLYVHVPFCAHHCGYCNFTVMAGRDDLSDRYLDALELEMAGESEPHPMDTIFFGGGTPTHLAPSQLQRLCEIVRRRFPPAPTCEWSVEANPNDITPERSEILAAAGVNRLSLGVQSFRAEKLRLLEREHSAESVTEAWRIARPHFASLGIDLIFAAPGETLDQWKTDLRRAIALGPEHVSTYGLTFERGTRFWSRRQKGELRNCDEELEREMYLAAIDALTSAGLAHYEISNFARPGFRCRHNQQYWTGEQYFAFGPGAARHVAGRRETNHRSTTTWMARVMAGRSPVTESEELSPEAAARERLVFGLRQLEGVDRDEFFSASGREIAGLGGEALARWIEQGLLEWSGPRLRLTRAGLLISDALWPDLI